MSSLSKTLAILALLPALAGCSSGSNQTPTEPLTALPRPLTAAEQRVVAGSNAFAFRLLGEVARADPAGNVFLSPISASLALGMTANGARGETLDGMRSALGFGSAPLEQIDPAYHDLTALVLGLDRGLDVRVANSIWARKDFPFLPSFYDVGRRWFDAEVTTLDFDDPGAAPTINAWVNRSTGGKIPTIVEAPIDPAVVMYLINATYFKGAWRERFDPARTVQEPFHRGDGRTQTVPMMHRAGDVAYFEAADARGVELPYGRGAFVMDVVLPATGTVGSLVAALDTTRWAGWLRQLHPTQVDLALPRFRLENDRLLNEPLMRLGMQVAFTAGQADFTGMSPAGKGLFISKVKQKTWAEVNEEGTEAAAATSVEISKTAMPVRTPFIVDRPFLLAIRERLSGTILFVGVVQGI